MSEKREVVGVKHWDDIGYSAWASLSLSYPDTHVQFDVYEIVASDVTERVKDGTTKSYPRGYQRRDANSSPDPVEDRADAEVFLTGSVKWDGCSNWDFREDGYHFCGQDEAVAVGTLFQRLYEWARELGMDRL